jgi:hypothetical protein
MPREPAFDDRTDRGPGAGPPERGGDRPTARLGPVTFEFEQPQLESSGSATQATHEILPQDDDVDGPTTVVQPLGQGAREWTLTGMCYADTASRLDNLLAQTVRLRHHRHTGDVYVESVSTRPEGARDENGWRYTYTVTLTEL